MKRNLFSLLLFCLFTSFVWAAPSMDGPTGLITIPTAESLRYQEYTIGYDYNGVVEDPNTQSYLYKLHMGMFKGWEVGFVGGTVPTEGVFVNAKYYLMSDGSRYPVSIAIGTKNLGSRNDTDLYMVASKRFKGGVLGHFGFNANFTEEALNQSIIGGVEYLLNDYISILGDFSRADTDYIVNAGVVLYLGQNLLIRGSVLDIVNDSQDQLFTVGAALRGFI